MIIIILEYIFRNYNYLYSESGQIMKLFYLIKKNDPKDLIPIFRRFVASNEFQTRKDAILIYGRLFIS
jgi:hypothetical protein